MVNSPKTFLFAGGRLGTRIRCPHCGHVNGASASASLACSWALQFGQAKGIIAARLGCCQGLPAYPARGATSTRRPTKTCYDDQANPNRHVLAFAQIDSKNDAMPTVSNSWSRSRSGTKQRWKKSC